MRRRAHQQQPDDDRVGLKVVRGLALIFVLVSAASVVSKTGVGAFMSLFAAIAFLLTALMPRAFGRLVGGAIGILAALAMFSGAHGQVVLTLARIVEAAPFLLVAGLFVVPGIIDAALALFRPHSPPYAPSHDH